MLQFIDDAGLLSPAVCYERYNVTGIDKNGVLLDNGISLIIPGRIFKDYEISAVSIVVSTICPALEEQSAKMFMRKEPFKGYLLDSIGSAAVDMLSQAACSTIEAEAAEHNIRTSSPVGPGMFKIPVTEQAKLVELAGAERIGISLLPTCEMMPRKSVSMIIGMGVTMPSWSKEQVCRTCSLNKTCQYSRDHVD